MAPATWPVLAGHRAPNRRHPAPGPPAPSGPLPGLPLPRPPRPPVPRRIQRLHFSLLIFGRAMAALGAFSYCKAARAHRGARADGGGPCHTRVYTHTDAIVLVTAAPPGAVARPAPHTGRLPSPGYRRRARGPCVATFRVLSTTLPHLPAPTRAWRFPSGNNTAQHVPTQTPGDGLLFRMVNLRKSDCWLKGFEHVVVCLTFTNPFLSPPVRHPPSTAPASELGQRSIAGLTCRVQGGGGPQSTALPTDQQTSICHCGPACVCDEPPPTPGQLKVQGSATPGPLGTHSTRHIQPEGCSRAPLLPPLPGSAGPSGPPPPSPRPRAGAQGSAARATPPPLCPWDWARHAPGRSWCWWESRLCWDLRSLPTSELGGRRELLKSRGLDLPWGN